MTAEEYLGQVMAAREEMRSAKALAEELGSRSAEDDAKRKTAEYEAVCRDVQGRIAGLRDWKERKVLRLFYIDGKKPHDVAGIMRMSARSIRRIRASALEHLGEP